MKPVRCVALLIPHHYHCCCRSSEAGDGKWLILGATTAVKPLQHCQFIPATVAAYPIAFDQTHHRRRSLCSLAHARALLSKNKKKKKKTNQAAHSANKKVR